MLRFLLLFLHNTDKIPYFTEFISRLPNTGFTIIRLSSSALPSGLPLTDCLLLTDSDAALDRFSALLPCIGLQNPSVPEQSLTKAYALLESLESADFPYLERTFAHAKQLSAAICTTKRLLVREFSMSDFEALYAMRSRPENNRYLTERPKDKPTEEEKLSAYISNVYPFFDFALWGVFERETGALVGQVGFSAPKTCDYTSGSFSDSSFLTAPDTLADNIHTPASGKPFKDASLVFSESLSFGYMIDLPYRQRGYAKEAVFAALSYAKELGLTQCIAQIQNENLASQKVLSGCGFPYRQIRSENGLTTYLLTLER